MLMRALDAAGDRPGAIQHASEHAQRLRADLELQPDPEVIALANELRAAPVSLELSTPNAASGRARTSIAVLPFVNLSAHPDNEYFADGLTEDVIAELSKIRVLRVTSGAPTTRDRRERGPKEIGQALGATLVLDGSVRRSADNVRIVAKLIDVESEHHVWAETYDRRPTDIFSIQTDVALRIASALEAELRPSSRGSTSSNVGSGFVRRTRHSLGALRDAVRTRGTSASRS
jgi:TolB-like protein